MRMRLVEQNQTSLLASLHAQCFRDAWSDQAFCDLLTGPGMFALVDEAAVGFILARVAAGESEVISVGVIPAARRRGTGAALVAAAAEQAAKMGAEVMFLEVGTANNPAIALYKCLGFQAAGIRKGYYAGPHGMREDALVLRATIPLSRVGNLLQLG